MDYPMKSERLNTHGIDKLSHGGFEEAPTLESALDRAKI